MARYTEWRRGRVAITGSPRCSIKQPMSTYTLVASSFTSFRWPTCGMKPSAIAASKNLSERTPAGTYPQSSADSRNPPNGMSSTNGAAVSGNPISGAVRPSDGSALTGQGHLSSAACDGRCADHDRASSLHRGFVADGSLRNFARYEGKSKACLDGHCVGERNPNCAVRRVFGSRDCPGKRRLAFLQHSKRHRNRGGPCRLLVAGCA